MLLGSLGIRNPVYAWVAGQLRDQNGDFNQFSMQWEAEARPPCPEQRMRLIHSGPWMVAPSVFSQGKLKKVDVFSGRSSQVLCDAPHCRGGAWNRDGVILFSPEGFGGCIGCRGRRDADGSSQGGGVSLRI